ncbi:MAG: hypothetical protein HZB56_02285 [Deltaproteobacteria bacterium]|nr:hypothetical protein [Deltaproteobacteria bacterium]
MPKSMSGASLLLPLAALAAAGCASGPALRDVSATFTIARGEKDCPAAVSMEKDKRNCPSFLFSREDCVRVDRKGKATIVFRGAEGVKPFAVYFQPFAPLRTGGDRQVSFELDQATPPKEYAFSVVAEGCKVIDPSIIVDP